MARTNRTDYALLGILGLEPMSGYDIRQFIQGTIGFFWQESYGQIYPGLKRLHQNKLVTKRKAQNSGGPARYVYRITPKGRRELASWLAAETEPEPVRHELLLKLFFGLAASVPDLVRHVENLREQQKGRLKQFETIEKELTPQLDDTPSMPYWYTTLRYGLHLTRARMRWCNETLEWLNGNSDQST